MKKTISLLIAICICFMLMPSAFADAALTVDGSWSILVPLEPTIYEQFSAEKLQTELKATLGAELPITTQAKANYIAVGAASEADVSDLAANGYRICTANGNIHIGGTGVSGLQAGVYRFLETFCGRKVYTYNIIVQPAVREIRIPLPTDIVYEPYFEYTDTDWLSPCDMEYSMANGLNGGTYRSFPQEMGSTVDYLDGFCHTIGGLCETAQRAQTDPLQLALHNGERTTDQPCLTNPDALATATKNVLEILSRRHDPAAGLQIVSVTQNDNYNYCECENCRAFEAAHGGVQSATMINFVNQIADAVKEAGYDNVAIDTFAYQYTRKAPTGIVPRDNVIVRLCTIECCFCHPLDDPNCPANVELMQDLRDWAAICSRIYVWDYTTNYSNTCCVFPDFNVIQRNIQVFYENNVKGVYEEGNYYIRSCNTEFGELRAYMIAKSLQDPYRDLNSEIDGFLAAYYGPGGESIKAAVDMFCSHAGGTEGGHVSIGEAPSASMHFTDREVMTIDGFWKTAKSAAQTAEQLANIERSELSWRFWKGSVNVGEFSVLNPNRYKEKMRLYEDIKASGATMISEGGDGDYLDCLCPQYVNVNEWNSYEADEPAAHGRLLLFRIIDLFTPLLSAFGLFYAFFRIWNRAGNTIPGC